MRLLIIYLTSIVPPPLTVYKNLYKIGHGIKVKLYSEGSSIDLNFMMKIMN